VSWSASAGLDRDRSARVYVDEMDGRSILLEQTTKGALRRARMVSCS
jgi:hypothetical protein